MVAASRLDENTRLGKAERSILLLKDRVVKEHLARISAENGAFPQHIHGEKTEKKKRRGSRHLTTGSEPFLPESPY